MTTTENSKKTSLKVKLLIGALVLMFLLNIATLGFMFMRSHWNHDGFMSGRKHGPLTFITKKLDFSPEQTTSFEKLSADHETMMDSMRVKKDALRRSQMELIKQDIFHKKEADSLAQELGVLQTKMESEKAEFFFSVKSLCTPDQLKEFNTLLDRFFQKGQRFHKRERE